MASRGQLSLFDRLDVQRSGLGFLVLISRLFLKKPFIFLFLYLLQISKPILSASPGEFSLSFLDSWLIILMLG